ncbi:MAG: prepilin-type N-terminal cleavage/methylation domain-containing protein [Candidatus Hinthialibacter antarcticus]|nr:prepilin-type N-terminal cleavage/methylation domain-containing protein [Candidatus Hinthialibacter antarcticus]
MEFALLYFMGSGFNFHLNNHLRGVICMKKPYGFTLIELLIVVAIIGILAAIAVPNFLNAQMKARISRVQADQKAVSTALEMYFLDHNSYVEDHDYPSDTSQRGLFRLTHPTSYMASLPLDPFPSNAFQTSEENPNFEFGSGNPQNSAELPNVAYIIISPGPNLQEEVDGNDSFPVGTTIFSFDVSNGLTSRGDIVRMGGNYNSGRIFMDGKMIVGN